MLESSRRDLLRAGARGLAAGTMAGVAGCSALRGRLQSGPFGDVATPARGPAGYRNLVPERMPVGPLWHVLRVDVSALDRPWLSPAAVATTLTEARRSRDYLGLARDAVDAVTWIKFDTAVVRGRFSPVSVERTLQRGGYERAGDHAGFSVFERPEDARSAAVGAGIVVWSGTSSPAAYARRVVDAVRGRAPRLVDSDDDFRRLTGSLGTGTVTSVFGGLAGSRGRRQFPGQVALGTARTHAPDGSYSTILYLFEDEPPTVDAVRGALRDGGSLDSFRRAEVHRGDRTVRVDGLSATDASAADEGPRPPVVPRVTFGFDHDPDAGTVTVTHEAGDPALARRLTVEADGPTGRQFGDRYVTVAPGDHLTVEPRDAAGRLRVTWEGDATPGRAIGQFRLPSDDG